MLIRCHTLYIYIYIYIYIYSPFDRMGRTFYLSALNSYMLTLRFNPFIGKSKTEVTAKYFAALRKNRFSSFRLRSCATYTTVSVEAKAINVCSNGSNKNSQYIP